MTTSTHTLWRHLKAQTHIDRPCSEPVNLCTETIYPLRAWGTGSSLVIEKCLSRKSLLRLVGDHRGERISCLNGVIWITRSGNPEDILVCAGESFSITEKGSFLIEGLAETRRKNRVALSVNPLIMDRNCGKKER